jgi:uncharacterized protein (DUF1697 family)
MADRPAARRVSPWQDAVVRTHVALLRGINVGGRNKVAMTDLREITASRGHADVTTYIQSGNVLFTSPETDTVQLADALETAIADRLGLRPAVVVLSRDQLAGVIAANPYPPDTDPRRLHAVFRRAVMTPAEVAAVAEAQQRAAGKGSRDDVTVIGATLYLNTPDGIGRSELAAQLARNDKKTPPGTARNWSTVTKLLALLDQP